MSYSQNAINQLNRVGLPLSSEEENTNLELMLERIQRVEHKLLVSKMLPKKHVVKHELPVPEGQFATELPVSDKDYIVAGTKLWKCAPLDASYFDGISTRKYECNGFIGSSAHGKFSDHPCARNQTKMST
eukprot:Awhi_evm1s1658